MKEIPVMIPAFIKYHLRIHVTGTVARKGKKEWKPPFPPSGNGDDNSVSPQAVVIK